MKYLQKMGGIAALIGGATNILGLVVYATLLLPKGGDSKGDPGQYVAFLAANQAVMRLWYQIIWLVWLGIVMLRSNPGKKATNELLSAA